MGLAVVIPDMLTSLICKELVFLLFSMLITQGEKGDHWIRLCGRFTLTGKM